MQRHSYLLQWLDLFGTLYIYTIRRAYVRDVARRTSNFDGNLNSMGFLASTGLSGSSTLPNLTHLSAWADRGSSHPSLHALTLARVLCRQARPHCGGDAGPVSLKPCNLARHSLKPGALGAPQPSFRVVEAPRIDMNGSDGMHGFGSRGAFEPAQRERLVLDCKRVATQVQHADLVLAEGRAAR